MRTVSVHVMWDAQEKITSRPHYFPVTLLTHKNAAHGIVAVLARV